MKKLSAVVVMFVALIPVIAFAEVVANAAAPVVAEQKLWMFILNNVLTIIFTIITPVLSYLVWKLLAKWKINLNLSTIDNVVTKAANYGEEKAHQALKAGKPLDSSAEKMKAALDIANTLIVQYKLPKMAEEQLIKLIESKLGESRVVVSAPAKVAGTKDEITKP